MTILFAFGMPGVMSSWGVAAVHALAREAFGDYAIIATDTVDELRQHVVAQSGKNAVLVSQFPEPKLSELILRVNVPFLLFLEDPVDAVSYLARAAGYRSGKGGLGEPCLPRAARGRLRSARLAPQ